MAENGVNDEENLNSQSSQLEEEDLQKLEADCVPVNTKKQTSWGLKKFTQWIDKRKITCDLHTASPTGLNGIQRKFFAEVKTNKKTDLTPSALTGIWAAIHCTITEQPISRSITILKDVEFTQANKMFEVVCKSYYKRGNPKPQHKNPIEAGDIEKLNSYFSNACPGKLQEFVWFNFCYYLGRRGREGLRELTKNSLEFKHDDQNKEYVSRLRSEALLDFVGYRRMDNHFIFALLATYRWAPTATVKLKSKYYRTTFKYVSTIKGPKFSLRNKTYNSVGHR